MSIVSTWTICISSSGQVPRDRPDDKSAGGEAQLQLTERPIHHMSGQTNRDRAAGVSDSQTCERISARRLPQGSGSAIRRL